jgi:uncharacterized protein (DUF302 family)
MDYYFTKILDMPFDAAIARTVESLKSEGFGVISEINMHEKFKEKLGVDFKRYRILGACNPGYAYKAVTLEEKIGTMLPCNVIVIDQGNGRTEVSAVNPIASMMSVSNPGLGEIATEVTGKLRKIIDVL